VARGGCGREILARVGLTTQSENLDGADNTIKTTAIGPGWGIGITYWYSRHWCLSFSAGNPLVQFSQTAREQPAPLDETKTSTTAFAAIFDSTVAIMIHLFN